MFWDYMNILAKSAKLILINPYPAKLGHFNFHPLEVVSRYRDPQLQVGENYSYLFSLIPNICNFLCFNAH